MLRGGGVLLLSSNSSGVSWVVSLLPGLDVNSQQPHLLCLLNFQSHQPGSETVADWKQLNETEKQGFATCFMVSPRRHHIFL